MEARVIAFILVMPFALAFIYAVIHELLRYKSAGRTNYGLVYDEETGTTHVTGIPEGEEAFDPETFDPSGYNEPDIRREDESEDEDEDEKP